MPRGSPDRRPVVQYGWVLQWSCRHLCGIVCGVSSPTPIDVSNIKIPHDILKTSPIGHALSIELVNYVDRNLLLISIFSLCLVDISVTGVWDHHPAIHYRSTWVFINHFLFTRCRIWWALPKAHTSHPQVFWDLRAQTNFTIQCIQIYIHIQTMI